jgi:hypothetical protein
LRPRVQEVVDDCIEELLAAPRPLSLAERIALPVPSLVVWQLVGEPYDDHDFFQNRSTALFHKHTGGSSDPTERSFYPIWTNW